MKNLFRSFRLGSANNDEESSEGSTKQCRYCKEEILRGAEICKHCGKKQPNKKFNIAAGVIIGIYVFIVMIGALFPSTPSSQNDVPKIQTVNLSETQCKDSLDELYAVVNNGATAKSSLVKSLLEQYATDAGLKVKNRSNPNTQYVMPNSTCGRTLDGLIQVIIQGEINARAN